MYSKSFTIASIFLLGCSSSSSPIEELPKNELSVCVDGERQALCSAAHGSAYTAVCYSDRPGPNPIMPVPGQWAEPGTGCVAIKDMNMGHDPGDSDPTHYYTWEWQWWCCDTVPDGAM